MDKDATKHGKLHRQARILITLASLAIVNWFVFFGISMVLGGVALGTTPSQDGFIVTSHGQETKVSESVWLFSLFYPYATLTIAPGILVLLGARYFHRFPRRLRWFFVFVISLWALGWYYAVTRDFLHSLFDYLA